MFKLYRGLWFITIKWIAITYSDICGTLGCCSGKVEVKNAIWLNWSFVIVPATSAAPLCTEGFPQHTRFILWTSSQWCCQDKNVTLGHSVSLWKSSPWILLFAKQCIEVNAALVVFQWKQLVQSLIGPMFLKLEWKSNVKATKIKRREIFYFFLSTRPQPQQNSMK